MSERVEYPIQGGDYDGGGRASRDLKERLKRMGVEPAALRRAMVAAYEAEMNVVIHAHRGWLRAEVSPGRLEVEVEDEGPGIADTAQAMREGFSTAPARARELGFGAGMGLPNIRKNSNWFELESVPGRGTRLRFRIALQAGAGGGDPGASLRLVVERCNGCRRCLAACPTQALRLHGPAPSLLAHLCLDCTACAAACPRGVFQGLADEDALPELRGAALVLTAVWLAGFAPRRSPVEVLAALDALGVARVILLDDHVQALRDAVRSWRPAGPRPVLSPTCPAAVELLRLRYPSLLGDLAPFLSPVEAALREAGPGPVVVVAACPAQQALARAAGTSAEVRLAAPQALRRRVWEELEGRSGPPPGAAPPDGGEVEGLAPGWLRVTGLAPLRTSFEALEDGLLADLEGLEGWACDQGCAGSAWLDLEPHLARHRLRRWLPGAPASGSAHVRAEPWRARPGMRLDPHLPTAMQRLREIDLTLRRLPGIDCGLCGAPTCVAFAEDVVLGRARRPACPHADREEATPP